MTCREISGDWLCRFCSSLWSSILALLSAVLMIDPVAAKYVPTSPPPPAFISENMGFFAGERQRVHQRGRRMSTAESTEEVMGRFQASKPLTVLLCRLARQ